MAEKWQLTPYLTVPDAAAAIRFYQDALGAKLVNSVPTEDGKKLMHVEMSIHGAKLYLSDDFPEWHDGKRHDAKSIGGTPVTLHLEVPDAVAVANYAAQHGATIVMPVEKQFWGDIYGQFTDPYGLVWAVLTPSTSEAPAAI
jgi:PhnB protein